MPNPNNKKTLQMYLGFINFFRKFIPHYAEIVAPLYKLLKAPEFIWSEECMRIRNIITDKIINSAILQYPDLNKPFIIRTDASDIADLVAQRNFIRLHKKNYLQLFLLFGSLDTGFYLHQLLFTLIIKLGNG